MPPPQAEAGLVRVIGVRRLTAIIVNTTVGAGIFVLPATAAANLGQSAPFAYLVCGGAMALIVTCIAAAGSRVGATGGLSAYVEAAFGPFAGFLTAFLYWVSTIFAAASIVAALLDSIGSIWPAFNGSFVRFAAILAVIGTLAGVNIRGTTLGSRLIEGITVLKLLPLVALVGAGVWIAPVDPASWLPVPEASDLGRTAIVLIFAFVGIEVALVPSGEIRNPARTVPRAAFLALAFTTLLYGAVQAVVQAMLGPARTGASAAPLAEAASLLLGAAGRSLMLVAGAVSMLGYLSGDMLGTPRAVYAMARDGLLPRAFASIHPRFHTPWSAIALHALALAALASTGQFTVLIVMANVATLLLYLSSAAAAYQLQRVRFAAAGPPFVLPGGPLIPLAASVSIVWLLAQATSLEYAVTAGVLLAASVLYAVRRSLESGNRIIG